MASKERSDFPLLRKGLPSLWHTTDGPLPDHAKAAFVAAFTRVVINQSVADSVEADLAVTPIMAEMRDLDFSNPAIEAETRELVNDAMLAIVGVSL